MLKHILPTQVFCRTSAASNIIAGIHYDSYPWPVPHPAALIYCNSDRVRTSCGCSEYINIQYSHSLANFPQKRFSSRYINIVMDAYKRLVFQEMIESSAGGLNNLIN